MSLETRLNELSQEIATLGGVPDFPNKKVNSKKLHELNAKIHALTVEVFETPGASESE